MATLAFTHDYVNAYGGVFGGDDSLVFLPEDMIVPDQSQILA